MARKGKKVLILDGDLGMANIDILFGVRPEFNIDDVVQGKMSIADIILPITSNISLIPGGSGLYNLIKLSAIQRQSIMDQVSELEDSFDLMLIDTASGIDDNVIFLNAAAQEIVVIVTPEPASLTDAYALIKVMNQRQGEQKFSIVANMVQDEAEGLWVYRRLSDVAQKFLNVSLDYKGCIPMDQNLRAATKSQQLIGRENPLATSSIAIANIAEKLSHFDKVGYPKGGMQFFWNQMLGQAC
jgi:flagellar biosynthesis protein FlhG